MSNGTEARPSGHTRRAVIGAGAALLGAGCVRPRDPRALGFWAMSYEGDYAPHLMTGFTARTGIPVEVQSLAWTAAHEKLLTAHAGGDLPDVFMLPNGWVGEFAMVGAIAPLPDPALAADLFPGAIDTVSWAGRPYAVPWSMAPQAQFYRRDLLAEVGYDRPPTDWDGWKRMGHALKRRRPRDFAVLSLLNWWDVLFTFAAQTGGYPLRDRDTRGNFRTPAFREAFAFYLSLFAEGLAPVALSTEVQDPVAAFAQGFFAIYPNGPPLMLDLHRREAELAPDRWAIERMPGPQGAGAASAVSASLAVSATTRRPREAWALLRHLCSGPSELRFQQLIGVMPARASAWATPQLRTERLRPFAEQVLQPAPTPRLIEWERIRIDVQTVAEKVVRGQLGPEEGLLAMDVRVDRLLAKRRALVDAGTIA